MRTDWIIMYGMNQVWFTLSNKTEEEAIDALVEFTKQYNDVQLWRRVLTVGGGLTAREQAASCRSTR